MRSPIVLLTGATVVALLLVGCGGSAGPSQGGGTTTGAVVQGQVVYFDSESLPVTGVVVNVGTTQVTTTNSVFKADVAPGTYDVSVVPPEGFSLPPSSTVQVTVTAGQTYTITAPFVLIGAGDQPPGPP